MMPRESEEGQVSEENPGEAETEDVEALKQTIAEEKTTAETNMAGWQRAQADFVNYKRRTEQEKEDLGRFANATLIISLLPILDDLERAFTSVPHNLAKLSWVDGIRLIERKLRAFLEAQGLSSIETLGEPFDPNLHEAAMHGKGKEGIVIDELQKGYKLHDRIIRPATVVVGNGEEDLEKNKEE